MHPKNPEAEAARLIAGLSDKPKISPFAALRQHAAAQRAARASAN
jgi:hypothetical protein